MNGFTENLTSYIKSAKQGFRELKNLSLSRLGKVFSLMGKKEKIALAILLVLAALSFFVSARNFYYRHTKIAPSSGGNYIEGLLGQPTYINPLLATSEPDLTLTNLIFSGLYKYDQNGQIIPDLADSMPKISADQKQYIVNLKRNAKWHNGKQVNADDVIFTIQTLQDQSFKSPVRPLWQATTVTKLSDYSVKFSTNNVSGPFLQNLTLPILPKAIWGNVDTQNFLLSKFNLEAIGSGPYAIKEIKKLPSGKIEQITLNSFDDYYQGSAKIDQIVFKFYDTEEDVLNAFHSREIKGFGFVPLSSGLVLEKNQTGAQTLNIPLPQYQVIFFNLNNKILSDLNVRAALSLATDKLKIIDQIFNGQALMPVSPLVFNKSKNPIPVPSVVDLNKAKSLLDTAGWTVSGKTGLRTNKKGDLFQINIATNDSVINTKAAEMLADEWQELNVKVTVTVLQSKLLTDTLIKPRTFDVLLFPQKFGADPDPFLFWHSSQVKDPGFNLTGFVDPTADKLITDARSTTDKQIREADYEQFNSLIMQKVPIIFLDQTEYIYTLDNEVKNVNLKYLYDPSLRFDNISDWYASEKRVWK